MRPEFRSTRSARVVPSWQNSMSKNKKVQPTRPISLPPTISSHPIPGASDPSWKKQGRHRMTDEQLSRLDALYERKTHPTTEEKQALGIEIGLEVKTVSVWFQNKRQTEKKAASSSTSSSSSSSQQPGLKRVSSPSRTMTLGKRTRPPHYTDKYQPAASRRKPFLSAIDSRSLSTVSCQTDREAPWTYAKHSEPQIHRPTEVLDDATIPAQELWKHLLSSPPTASEESPHASSDIDPRERLTNIPVDNLIDNQDSTIEGSSRTSRMLEWVCDRQTKRRRNNRGDPADSAQLVATEDTDGTCRNCLRRPDLDTAISLLTLPGDIGPSEDVIRAASLLLCFKYSAQKPREASPT